VAAFRRAHIAIVPQSAALVPFLTAGENIELELTMRGVDAGNAQTLAADTR
jgi:ABC-type lipoprotein export system ATPase subunit